MGAHVIEMRSPGGVTQNPARGVRQGQEREKIHSEAPETTLPSDARRSWWGAGGNERGCAHRPPLGVTEGLSQRI